MFEFLGENLPTILTFISGVVVVFYGTRYTVNKQTNGKLSEVQMEGDVKTEELYVTNMSMILAEYKEQVSGYKKQMEEANNRIKALQEEFSEFREQHQKEITEYKKEIVFWKNRVDELEDENDTLKLELERGNDNGK